MDTLVLCRWLQSLVRHMQATIGLVLTEEEVGFLAVELPEGEAHARYLTAPARPASLERYRIDIVGAPSANTLVGRVVQLDNVVFATVTPYLSAERMRQLDEPGGDGDTPKVIPFLLPAASSVAPPPNDEVFTQHLGVFVLPESPHIVVARHNEIREVTIEHRLEMPAILAMMETDSPPRLPTPNLTPQEREMRALSAFLDLSDSRREEKMYSALRLHRRSEDIPPHTTRSILGYQTRSTGSPVVSPVSMFSLSAHLSVESSARHTLGIFSAIVPYAPAHPSFAQSFEDAVSAIKQKAASYFEAKSGVPFHADGVVWTDLRDCGATIATATRDFTLRYTSSFGPHLHLTLEVTPL